jgi:GNAT superfamily N-acetyltransferase
LASPKYGGQAGGMDILDLQPDDLPTVTSAVELQNAAETVDAPWRHPTTVVEMVGRLKYGWDLEPEHPVVGVIEGEALALGSMDVTEWDNTDLAWLHVTVRPDARGRGLGQQMLDHLIAMAQARGRTKLGADAWDGSPGIAFAEKNGFEKKSQAINRRQHLAEVSFDRIQKLYDEACTAASAYEVVRVLGRTPDELMPAVTELSASINDAPLDDLEIEDEQFTPERMRNYETAQLSRGQRLYRLLARHRDTGALAGHTVVTVLEERPGIAYQHDTSVVRDHRGHRLGLLLKTGMNLWLRDVEPQLETVDTWNAESNDHMIGVNEELGYRAMGRELQFQRGL